MSDFKRKIEIVESTTPPPNKYNWWFDLNARKLKRFDGGEWGEYSVKPEIVVPMPKDNEIWLQLDSDSHYISEDDIEKFIQAFDYFMDDLDSYKHEGHVLKLVFNYPINSITYGQVDAYVGDAEIISMKLPKLNIIGDEGGTPISGIPVVIIQDTTEILDWAIYCGNLICLAQTPPKIGDLSGDPEMGEGVSRVYVRDSVIEKYKSATNWSSMDIKELSSLDKSVYNWG
jgi:hypothetical protein